MESGMNALNKYARLFKVLRMELGLTQRELAAVLDISPGSVYKYENTIMTPGTKTLDKVQLLCDDRNLGHIVKGLEEEVHIEDENKEIADMNANYIIDLQKDKIEHQQQQITNLKKTLEDKQAESTHWDGLEYDFETKVTLVRSRFRIGRVVDSVDNIKEQSRVLGYSVSELNRLWNIGRSYEKIADHPIDTLISKSTQTQMQKQISTLPILFDAMKSVVGDHYIPFALIYKHKEGHKIGAISYNKVQWKELKVTSKVKFLID